MQHTGVTGSPAVTRPSQMSHQQQLLSQQLIHPGAESAWPLLVPIHRAGTCASLQCPPQPHSRAWWGIHSCTSSVVSFLHLPVTRLPPPFPVTGLSLYLLRVLVPGWEPLWAPAVAWGQQGHSRWQQARVAGLWWGEIYFSWSEPIISANI